MNYHQLTLTKDKAVHILRRTHAEDMYGYGILQCIELFGEELTQEAAAEFKKQRLINERRIAEQNVINSIEAIDYFKYEIDCSLNENRNDLLGGLV